MAPRSTRRWRGFRGPRGSEVILTIVRAGGAPFKVKIVRDTIVSHQVQTRELADGAVTYVRVAGFSDNAARQFTEAIAAAREQGVTKFVVDLRDNPGGYVTAARTIASQFIGEGPVYWEEAADGTQVATNAEPGGAATARHPGRRSRERRQRLGQRDRRRCAAGHRPGHAGR